MRDEETTDMTPTLRRGIQMLRDDAQPADAWRAGLLTAIAEAPAPRRTRRWSMTPLTAIAAGICCAIAGAWLFAIVSRRGPALEQTGSPAAVAVSTVRFTIDAPDARQVSLVGDFNSWRPATLPLARAANGRTWVVDVPLAPGRYVYSFVVDGSLAIDPAAPRATDDDFGTPSSVVLVTGSGS